jgi:XTP/dITP diphosphohydrolase
MRIVLASGNAHKAAELTRLLPGWDVEPWPGELPEETGQTFEDNALLKARHVWRELGGAEWVLADDSGIAAEALGGAPGVRSARFAGERATDEQNLQKLLDSLAGGGDRRVAYVAVLVAISPDGEERVVRGELRGTLATEPRGTGGFGYDPAFVPEGESRTVGEMRAEEKDAISHRARAAAELRELLP